MNLYKTKQCTTWLTKNYIIIIIKKQKIGRKTDISQNNYAEYYIFGKLKNGGFDEIIANYSFHLRKHKFVISQK